MAVVPSTEIRASPAAPDVDRAELSYREALGFAAALSMRPLFAHWYLGLGKLHRRTGHVECSTW